MDDTSNSDPKRRTFLAVASASGCAAVAVGAGPALALVSAPATETSAPGAKFVVGKLSQLEVGVPKRFAIVGDEVDAWTRAPKRKLGAVWLTRKSDREVVAFSATCPHLGCGVDLVEGEDGKPKAFNCPCHDSNFDLQGNAGKGPSPRGMDPLPVEIASDEAIVVTFKRYRLGVPDRQEL